MGKKEKDGDVVVLLQWPVVFGLVAGTERGQTGKITLSLPTVCFGPSGRNTIVYGNFQFS
jgi:hypothetical protein